MARKKYLDPIHPGEILLDDFMRPLGLSINRLGVCPTLTVLLRRTICAHLCRTRPAPKNRET